MSEENEIWHPGSFTKNFSWGPPQQGLKQLHEAIRIGFDNQIVNVSRDVFRQRIAKIGRPDYIPANFFLFNKIFDDSDFIVVDELVYQALSFRHSDRFDKIAITAFNLSLAGRWRRAQPYQSKPALWAHHYVRSRLGPVWHWDTSKITADDIETFVRSDPHYQAEGARKLATNLAYMYRQADIGKFAGKKVERWWVDSLFTAMDRIIENRLLEGRENDESKYLSYLTSSGFFELSGERSIAKDLASQHLVRLYAACGGRSRFSDEETQERSSTLLSDIENYVANNPDPIGAVHRSNVNIVKSLPRVCAALTRFAGFDVFDLDDLENMDTSTLARQNIERALANLRSEGISPSITSEELLKMMRD